MLIAFLSIISSPLSAQYKHKKINTNLVTEGRIFYGFIIPHHVEMEIYNSHLTSFELSISKATYGGTRWEYMFNYPIVGLSYFYSDLGKSPYLGEAHAIMPYILFPLTQNKKTRLFFKTGLGIGYLTKSFNRIENYKNIAIGSNINAAVNLQFELRHKLTDRFIISIGSGLIHFSNGSMKTPNYGLNIPNINFGVSYRLSKPNPYYRKKLLPKLEPYFFDGKKFFEVNFAGGLGYKNMEAEVGGKFLVWNIFGNVLRAVSFKSKIGLGFDISNDGTDEYLLLQKYGETIDSRFQLTKTGIDFTYYLMMSRVSFTGNIGYYVSGKYKGDGRIYEKIGVLYRFTRELFAHLTLKAHSGRADYISFGIGYKIIFKYY